MKYDQKDKEFQSKILNVLGERHMINANKEIGTAYFQPETEDKINPKVIITDNEIKKNTGRQKLRDSVYDEYVKALNKNELISAERQGNSISVSINPVRSPDNEYSSISSLEKQNSKEIMDDPDLGKPHW